MNTAAKIRITNQTGVTMNKLFKNLFLIINFGVNNLPIIVPTAVIMTKIKIIVGKICPRLP